MRVAIIGASGQLGTELMSEFSDMEPLGLTHEAFDIESAQDVQALLSDRRLDLIINTAAFHAVDRCELEPERAFAVNALAVERLAAACSQARVPLAHISTDYVFDGAARTPYVESDATAPINAYGISKVAGESLLRRRGGLHYIFRTSGLYAARGRSAKGKPFIERMLESAEGGRPLSVVDDVWFSPSYAGHVASAIRSVVEREVYGTYHVTNAGACTWHDFASEALRQARYTLKIDKTSATGNSSSVRRPAYSALSGRAMAAIGLPQMPAWQDGIEAFLKARSAQG